MRAHSYRVLVRGHDFSLMIDGAAQMVGFYVAVFADGENAGSGRENALQILGSRLRKNRAIVTHGRIEVESVEAIEHDEIPDVQPGIAWYRQGQV